MPGIDLNSILQLIGSKRGSRPAGIASGGRQLPMEAIQRRLMETLSGGGMDVSNGRDGLEWSGPWRARWPPCRSGYGP